MKKLNERKIGLPLIALSTFLVSPLLWHTAASPAAPTNKPLTVKSLQKKIDDNIWFVKQGKQPDLIKISQNDINWLLHEFDTNFATNLKQLNDIRLSTNSELSKVAKKLGYTEGERNIYNPDNWALTFWNDNNEVTAHLNGDKSTEYSIQKKWFWSSNYSYNARFDSIAYLEESNSWVIGWIPNMKKRIKDEINWVCRYKLTNRFTDTNGKSKRKTLDLEDERCDWIFEHVSFINWSMLQMMFSDSILNWPMWRQRFYDKDLLEAGKIPTLIKNSEWIFYDENAPL